MLGPVCWARCAPIKCDLWDLRSGSVSLEEQEKELHKTARGRSGPGRAGKSHMFKALTGKSYKHTMRVTLKMGKGIESERQNKSKKFECLITLLYVFRS